MEDSTKTPLVKDEPDDVITDDDEYEISENDTKLVSRTDRESETSSGDEISVPIETIAQESVPDVFATLDEQRPFLCDDEIMVRIKPIAVESSFLDVFATLDERRPFSESEYYEDKRNEILIEPIAVESAPNVFATLDERRPFSEIEYYEDKVDEGRALDVHATLAEPRPFSESEYYEDKEFKEPQSIARIFEDKGLVYEETIRPHSPAGQTERESNYEMDILILFTEMKKTFEHLDPDDVTETVPTSIKDEHRGPQGQKGCVEPKISFKVDTFDVENILDVEEARSFLRASDEEVFPSGSGDFVSEVTRPLIEEEEVIASVRTATCTYIIETPFVKEVIIKATRLDQELEDSKFSSPRSGSRPKMIKLPEDRAKLRLIHQAEKVYWNASSSKSENVSRPKKTSFPKDRAEQKLIREAEKVYSNASTSGDVVDGATSNIERMQKIATDLYYDDADELKMLIGKNPSKQEIQRRILEAVELNSLECLSVLCDIYKDNPVSSEDVALFYRRYGLSFWPLDDRRKETALHVLASKFTSIKAMEVLENQPAKFLNDFADVQDSHNSTPLLVALKSNNIEVVKKLLRTKPKINTKNLNGESPIHVAALNNYVDVIKEMIDMYSEPRELSTLKNIMKDINGDGSHTILFSASKSRKPGVLNLVMNEFGESWWKDFLKQEKTITADWGTFASNVCASGCTNLAESILRSKYPVLADVVTPLVLAAEGNHYEIVKLIFDIKADLSLFASCSKLNGRNVFHYAVGHPKILEYLLLQFVTFSENFEAINQPDDFDYTPIKLAAIGKSKESLTMLLEYATDQADIFSGHLIHSIDVEDLKKGLDIWREKDLEFVECLLRGDHKKHQPFLEAAKKGNRVLMEFFLQEGANCWQRTPNDQTALHYAVLSGKLDAVQYLLKKKEFLKMIDCTDEVNITAAGYATQIGHVEILRCLLEHKARMKGDRKTSRLNILDSAYGYFKTGESSIKEIIEFCTKEGKNKQLRELFEDSHFGPDCIISKLVEEAPNVAIQIFDLCVYEDQNFKHCSYGETKAEKRVTYSFFPFSKSKLSKEKYDGGKLAAIESMVNSERDDCLGHPLVIRFLQKKFNSTRIRVWLLLNVLLYIVFLLTLTTYGSIQSEGDHNSRSSGIIALSVIIFIICACHLIKEIIQMVVYKARYFHDFENYIEWVIFVCAVVYVIPSAGRKADIQIAAGVVSVFLGWINFSLFLRRFSLFGIYIIMAKRVFITVCKVLPLVVLFIAAFSFSFSLLMPVDQGFHTIPISLLTTFVMMTGELDYKETFLASGPLHILQKFLLVLFILMISIAIMNLLTGLAVDDANEIMKRSKEEKRMYRAMLVINLERTLNKLPLFSSPNGDKKEDEEKYPWFSRMWQKIFDDDDIDEQLEQMRMRKCERESEQFDETKELVQKIEEILARLGSVKVIPSNN